MPGKGQIMGTKLTDVEAKTVHDAYAEAEKLVKGAEGGILSGEAKERFEKLTKDAQGVMATAKDRAAFSGVLGDLDKAMKELVDPEDGSKASDERRGQKVDHRPAAYRSLGKSMVGSDDFKAIQALAKSDPAIFESSRRHLPEVSAHFGNAKALITSGGGGQVIQGSGTGAGVFVLPEFDGRVEDFRTWQIPLVIADLFNHQQVSTDTIYYVLAGTQSINAAAVAEATTNAAPTAPGTAGALVYPAGAGLKPESTLTFTSTHTTVKTLAHTATISKRALADAAQVVGEIDNMLEYGLDLLVENQLLNGDGTGENLLGLNNTSGTQTQAAVADSGATLQHNYFKGLLLAKNKVRVGAHVPPNAIVMNPADTATLNLLTTTIGEYYGGNPVTSTDGNLRVWGLPVVESESQAAGSAWLANWSRATVYDRMSSTLSMSDSHADYFFRNLVAILAELRLGFAVKNPTAFVKVTLSTAGS